MPSREGIIGGMLFLFIIYRLEQVSSSCKQTQWVEKVLCNIGWASDKAVDNQI